MFQNFYNMVNTQLHAKIQILRTDNGEEYFKPILNKFLMEKGIINQTSCVDTLQQKEISERKNYNQLELEPLCLLQEFVNIFGESLS